MKFIQTIIYTLALLGVFTAANAQYKKVLIVSTNIDSLQGDANGTFLMEIAFPMAEFEKEGIEVDILTPKGGKAAVYHRGKMDNNLAAIYNSEFFNRKVMHSLAPGQVKISDYGGIFYPGGGGQFYDVWNNDSIAKIAASIYESGGTVGAAGHGAVSLINIKLKDGSPFVKGKRITCFPKKISAAWLPVNWETALSEKGATVQLPSTPEEKENGLQVIDNEGRTITGSYAENAAWVAMEMAWLIKNN